MKKACAVTVLVFFVISFIVQSNTYYRSGESMINYPARIIWEEGGFVAALDGADKISFGHYSNSGETGDVTVLFKKMSSSDETRSVWDIVQNGDELYILWDKKNVGTGEKLGQGIEMLEGSLWFPKLSREYVMEVGPEDAYVLDDIEFLDSGSMVISGVSADMKNAVFFTANADTWELTDRTAYRIEGGAYKSFSSGGEKYCISIEGGLFHVGDGFSKKISGDAYVKVASPMSGGKVAFADVETDKLYEYDGEKVAAMPVRAEELVLKHSVDILDFSFSDGQNGVVKVSDKTSGDIYFVTVVAGEPHAVTEFGGGFGMLLQVVFMGNLGLYLIGAAVIIVIFFIVNLCIKNKKLYSSIVTSMVPLFIIFYVLISISRYYSLARENKEVYQEEVGGAAKYLAATYDTSYIDKITALSDIKEADAIKIGEGLLRDEDMDSHNFLIKIIDGGFYVYDMEKGIMFEKAETALSKELFVNLLNGFDTEPGKTSTYSRSGYLEAVYGMVQGESGALLLVSEYTIYEVKGYLTPYVIWILISGAVLTLALLLATAAVLKKRLRPISVMREEIAVWAEGRYKPLTIDKKSSEVFDIGRILNGAVKDFTAKIYQLSRLNEAYFRFVPKTIMELLDRESVVEVAAGDKKVLTAPVAYFLMLAGGSNIKSESERFEYSNKYFSILNSVLSGYGSMFSIINDDITKITSVFNCGTEQLIDMSKELMKAVERFNRYNNDSIVNPLIVIAKSQVTLAVAGDETRLAPMILTEENSTVDIINNTFHASGCEVILLQSAFKDMKDLNENDYRYIGYMEIENENKMIGMYDYFAAGSGKSVGLKRETQEMFNDGLMAFYAGDFAAAKELFSGVLKINYSDGIARWYLFRCYEYENAGDRLDVSYAIIKKKNFKGF